MRIRVGTRFGLRVMNVTTQVAIHSARPPRKMRSHARRCLVREGEAASVITTRTIEAVPPPGGVPPVAGARRLDALAFRQVALSGYDERLRPTSLGAVRPTGDRALSSFV